MITEAEDPRPLLLKLTNAIQNHKTVTLDRQELVTLWCVYGNQSRGLAGYRQFVEPEST